MPSWQANGASWFNSQVLGSGCNSHEKPTKVQVEDGDFKCPDFPAMATNELGTPHRQPALAKSAYEMPPFIS